MAHRVVYSKAYDSEIEYLESSGTQWINTLCPITLNTVFKVKFISLPNNADNTIVAAHASTDSDYSNYSLIMRIQRYLRRDISYNSFGNSGNITPSTDPVEITLASSYYQLNNETPQTFTPTIQTLPSFQVGTSLFAIHSTPSRVTNYAKIKLYYFQQYNDNTLIRDFIPVRVGQVGYMYDKVSGKLFGNKGTGNFILGPDISNPVPNIRRVFKFGNKRYITVSND